MSKSYIVSQRLRYKLENQNIKLVYSESFKYFDENLEIKDRSHRNYAMLLWSSLRYLEKEKTKEYEAKIIEWSRTKYVFLCITKIYALGKNNKGKNIVSKFLELSDTERPEALRTADDSIYPIG